MIQLHYEKGGVTEGGILSAIEKNKQRGSTVQQVSVNPANDIGKNEVDNVPVEIDAKVLPLNHFWVVV